MKICFVGHEFHQTSKSHVFFTDILEKIGKVEYFFHNPDSETGDHIDTIVDQILQSNYDRIIFWQTEYIADQIAARGDVRRLIVVPMWDAAKYHSNQWWHRLQTHQFISFSRELHEKLISSGLRSAYFQYFSKPADRIPSREPRSSFFWERRPTGTPNARQVIAQSVRLGIRKLHIHASADYVGDRRLQTVLSSQMQHDGLEISFSSWFERKADYEDCVNLASIFFAPRTSEGIGMSIIEAMGRGQVVIAPDSSTMNEYIGHGASGVLYRPGQPMDLTALSEKAIAHLSQGAFDRATRGYNSWLSDIDRLVSLICDDGRRWVSNDTGAAFANSVRSVARDRMTSGQG